MPVKRRHQIIDEIFSELKTGFIKEHTPQTVGEYYKKHIQLCQKELKKP